MATTSTDAAASNPATALYASLNGTKSAASSSTVSDTQSRFLMLLTTQLKNQDPLNPMDNAQMTSQLAQISTVDGITQLNTTLQTLLSNATQSQNLQAASLVGHSVLVPGSSLKLASGSAVGGYTLEGPADIVKIEIKNSVGDVVHTVSLKNQQAGVQAFGWDGKDDSGKTLADGAYTFAITATQGADKVKAATLSAGAVSAVVNGSKGISVDVGTLGNFATSDIKLIM